MRLRGVYFIPGVAVVSGITGYDSSLSCWRAEKHDKLKCVEQKNGDIHLISDDGVVREISALVIAYRVRVPDEVKPQTSALRREPVTT